MARKSRETVLKERLREISGCPFDIFRYLQNTDEIPELVARCETGDRQVIEELCGSLYSAYTDGQKPCEALFYLMGRALDFGITSVCETVIDYCSRTESNYPLAVRAINALSAGCGISEELSEKIIPLGARAAVSFTEGGADPLYILENMTVISQSDYPFEWLFIYRAAKKFDSARELSKSIGLEYTCLMPSFCGEDRVTAIPREVCDKEIKALSSVLMKHAGCEWRDLWLRCMYELMEKCDEYDKLPVAESAIAVSESRSYYKRHPLHTLAWCSYLLDFLPTGSRGFYELSAKCQRLTEQCLFTGINPHIDSDEERYALMRESVYLSSNAERKLAMDEEELGFKILHRKNRFSLECDLHGHGKRGKMHFWNVTLSLDTNEVGTLPPKIDKLSVSRTKNVIERGGVQLDRGKSACQAIYYSEICVNDVKHPFELDIILDISYISAVKCSEGEIRILDSRVKNGYLVMDCQLFLY